MEIKLYNCKSSQNQISKYLENEITINGTIRTELSEMTPSIMLDASTLPKYNYCYITSTDKYYYITNVTAMSNKMYKLDLQEDVLMTFKNEILNLNAIVSRSRYGDPYIDGDNIQATSQSATTVINYQSGFSNTPHNIIITAGG